MINYGFIQKEGSRDTRLIRAISPKFQKLQKRSQFTCLFGILLYLFKLLTWVCLWTGYKYKILKVTKNATN